ncbi:MAG: DUF1496 domain-containing protein [Gammaproteobacteria bacterium]|jgi:hypothetical protein
MSTPTIDLGSQDPERRNSPIAAETDEDTEVLRQEIPPEPVCYFNDKAYADGTIIKSGAGLLRCDQGLWVAAGSSDPSNP